MSHPSADEGAAPSDPLPVPAAGQSILPSIERRLGSEVRVALRSDGGGDGTESAEGGLLYGKYRLRGELGRGGVGVVLRGNDVDLGRDVAIKVLREEHQDRVDVLKRFVEEAQIGGQLQHPGVVPVYDLGMSEGRPFFAMKLIRGKSLEQLLRERANPREQRRRFLGIFEQVCQTLAYAHARGVIHRDLKPGNVMVGTFGEVQVVDWGMGKVLDRPEPAAEVAAAVRSEDAALEPDVSTVRSASTDAHSELGSMMGTPGYMPPEQARGAIHEIDERSDVFALGAILFEILGGTPPQVGAPMERLRMAWAWDSDAALARLAPFDVDADLLGLVGACLQKERDARPRSAQEVADRVAGWLSAVEERAQRAQVEAAEAKARAAEAEALEAELRARAAREEARAEKERAEAEQARLRAEAERKRRVAAVLILAALVVGVIGTTYGMLRADDQREQAEAARRSEAERAEGERLANEKATRRLEQVQKSNEILGAVFDGLDPDERSKEGISLQTALTAQLDKAIAQLEGDAIGDPLDVARMQMRLALSLYGLGEFERSEALLTKVSAFADANLPRDDPLAIHALTGIATSRGGAGRAGDAVAPMREAYDRLLAARGAEDPKVIEALANLGATLQNARKSKEARPLLEQALPLLREHLGLEAQLTLTCINNLAACLCSLGEPQPAIPLFEEAQQRSTEAFGPDNSKSIQTSVNLAKAYQGVGQIEKALATAESAYAAARRALGTDHPSTLAATNVLAEICRDSGNTARTVELMEEQRRLAESRYGPGDEKTLQAMNNLAAAYWSAHRFEEAIPLLEVTVQRRSALFGREDGQTQHALMNLGVNLLEAGRGAEAVPLFEENLRHAETYPFLLAAAAPLSKLYRDAGKPERALAALEETLRITRALGEGDPRATLRLMADLGAGYFHAGRLDRSIPLLEEYVEGSRKTVGATHPQTVLGLCNLGMNYMGAGRANDARRVFAQATEAYGTDPRAVHYAEEPAKRLLGSAYGSLGRWKEQTALLAEALAMGRTRLGPGNADHPEILAMEQELAFGYWRLDKLDRSIPLFEHVVRAMEARFGADDLRTLRMLANLGVNYLDAGRFTEAVGALERAHAGRDRDPGLGAILSPLVSAWIRGGKPEKALPELEKGVRSLRAGAGPDSPQLASGLAELSTAHLALKQFSEAEAVARECLGIRERVLPGSWATANAKSLLGDALLGLGRHEEAEPLLLDGYRALKASEASMPPQALPRVSEALERLIRLYETTGRDADAATWRRELEARRGH